MSLIEKLKGTLSPTYAKATAEKRNQRRKQLEHTRKAARVKHGNMFTNRELRRIKVGK